MKARFPSTGASVHEMKVSPSHRTDVLDQITPVDRLDSSTAEAISARLEDLLATYGVGTGDCLGTKESLRRRFLVSPATMNEAVRILESRGIVETRRGLRGGVFVSNAGVHGPMAQIARALDLEAPSAGYCWAVSSQLEPLVVAEAAKNAEAGSIGELNRLVRRMALDDSRELFRRYWFFYRKVAEMGSNRLLTAIYTALLKVLEQNNFRLEAVGPGQLAAKCRRVVSAIASRDARTAAALIMRDCLSLADEPLIQSGRRATSGVPNLVA